MIKRQTNWLSQQRVDVPHLRAMESSVAADFDDLIRGWVTQDSPYIIRGFYLVHSIGGPATDLQVSVEDSALFHSTAAEAGTILTVESGVSNEILNSSNDKVNGSFTAGTTNFVALDYVRAADDSTIDLVTFFSADTKLEFTKTVPLARTLNYNFVITTTGFGTLLPIAKVVTDATGTVTEITDSRSLLMRLGSGGTSPDPFNVYPWPDGPTVAASGRAETPSTSSGAISPFEGGDKEIKSMKNWMDAVMSRILELDGAGPFWYSASSFTAGSLKHLRQDAINIIATGLGRFVHSESTPGEFSWTSDVLLRWTAGNLYYRIPTGTVTLSDDEVAYIQLERDQNISPATLNFSNVSPVVDSATPWTAGLVTGDWVKNKIDGDEHYSRILTVDSALQVTLEANYTGTAGSGQNAQYTKGSYSVLTTARDALVNNNPDFYWLAIREDDAVSAATIDAAPTGAARSSNVVTITTTTAHGLIEGQTVNIAGVTDTSFNGTIEIDSVPSPTTFTYNQSGEDTTSGSGSVTVRAQIFLRWGQELEQGESRQINDQEGGEGVKEYVGMRGEVDLPNYLVNSDGLNNQQNYQSAAGEDLTARTSRLTSMVANKSQDRSIHMLFDGVVWSWNLTTETLSWSATVTFQLPSSADDNTLASGSTTLTSGQVAYVTLDRNSASALSITVVDSDSLPLNENVFIVARRDGDSVLVGSSFRLEDTDNAIGEYSDHLRNEKILKPIIDPSGASDSIFIYPSQRVSNGKKRYLYIDSSSTSKFPRDGSEQYDGGANNNNLTEIRFDPSSTPGTIEVEATLPSVIASVIGSVVTPSIGEFIACLISIGTSDDLTVNFGSSQASFADAISDDNLPTTTSDRYPVAIVILEVTGATSIASIEETDLLDRRPTGAGGGGGNTASINYYEYTATGGETLINLPFQYAPGNNSLEVIENGVELYVGASRDYEETSDTSITLNTPAVSGDRYKFRARSANYYEYTATGGETLINLPFQYSLATNELEVVENGIELYEGSTRDYVESTNTSITLNTPAVSGDRYKFRILRSTSISGSNIPVYRATAIDYLSAGEDIIGVTDTSVPRTVTLSDIDKARVREIKIKDESGGAGTNNITVTPESGTIDGVASILITSDYGVSKVYSNGTDWFSE